MTTDQYNRFPLNRTAKGSPGIWERGGHGRRAGYALLIAGVNGGRLSPLVTHFGGEVANSTHALFIARPGFLVAEVFCAGGSVNITLWRLTEVPRTKPIDGEDEADASLLCRFVNGAWSSPPPPRSEGFLRAVRSKVQALNCRKPYWYLEVVDPTQRET